ncbi:MAG: tRNA (adenosine(37)-N6)-threonylcarbamoyltransferase complex ATPase subunit type 1 TsaE [Candidatus Saganbacteria bacterium]|nr:tRNA (adenosine(37)-N6)-threonylcarbamoyltransferase complex ATPase subunit type 1 TsaE [Candidatus Saganbacteria bacterium]
MNAGSPSETRLLGKQLSADIRPGDVIALYGGLGAGKTTFVQGILQGLGISDNATSPSFVIMNEYPLKEKGGSLYHLDLYRLDSINDIEDLDIEDILNGDSILIIEWAEKMGSLLPEGCVKIYFEMTGEYQREIRIENESIRHQHGDQNSGRRVR